MHQICTKWLFIYNYVYLQAQVAAAAVVALPMQHEKLLAGIS